ncbi:MAG TPA: aldehyde dehydrogenase family protein [Steroidobacteraceae bacterium]|jgi:malonate-semialdehyde dehydrogenase (acetylating)/methylmalonate-semialdehyde dehydrogenase
MSEVRICKKEIFRQVLPVVRSSDSDTATKLVNDHEDGNGVAIFTRGGDAAREFANRIQIGMVAVNVPMAFTALAAGSAPCSATGPSTAWKACASAPASKP